MNENNRCPAGGLGREWMTATTHSRIRFTVLCAGMMLALATLSGCPSNLQLANVSVVSPDSAPSAAPGEIVTIQWDYRSPDLLRRQTIQPFFLTALGIQPGALQVLPIDAREFSFEFTAPVTVALICENANGPTDGIGLDFTLREDFEFKATVRALTAREYPRLGYPRNADNYELNFSQFVAFFDPVKDPNGVIDEFSPILANDFFFRAFTSNPQEVFNPAIGRGRFDFFQGAAYPFVVPTRPDQSPQANAMVFGGAIGYEGETFPVKSPDGEFIGRRGRGFVFEPIFMALAFLVNFGANPSVELAEVTIGNLSQGLVTPLVFGELQLSPPGARFVDLASATVDFSTDGTTTDVMEGFIKAAQLGVPITTRGGDIFDTFVSVENITWKMPFLFDNDLGGRVNFGPQAVR